MKQFHFFILVMILFISCDETENIDFGNYRIIQPENPEQKGERLFGINVSSSIYGFGASFSKAREAGIQVIELNIPWSSVETSKGNYKNPDNMLTDISFYGDNDVKVGLCLSVINTVKWEIPDYLNDVSVASDEFVGAFNDMFDWVIKQIPENVIVSHISIGNEVDFVLVSEQDWSDYITFYSKAVRHIKNEYPDLPVGVKTTIMDGVFGNDLKYIKAINEYSDVIMLNYYPQDEHFMVMPPEIPHQHFSALTSIFETKKIWLTELGYQSGHKYCGSTETKQAHFYHNVFDAWDAYSDHIELILVDWLYDQSPELIESWKEYYGNDPALVEYLSTLGLLNYDGTSKAAWEQVLVETEVRGW